MASNCTKRAADDGVNASFVDLGLDSSDMHTGFSSNTDMAALNAFLDFLMLMDATVIVRTGSSFSGTACLIKGLHCELEVVKGVTTKLYVCLPSDC